MIAKAVTEAIKAKIIQQLETQSSIKTTSTDLAIAAEQHTKKVDIPSQYQKFAKVFSEEESQRFPPSRLWDHMIEFKKDTPDAIDCKVYPCRKVKTKVSGIGWRNVTFPLWTAPD